MKLARILIFVVFLASLSGFLYINSHKLAEPCPPGFEIDDTSMQLGGEYSENCVHYRYSELKIPVGIVGIVSGAALAGSFIIRRPHH